MGILIVPIAGLQGQTLIVAPLVLITMPPAHRGTGTACVTIGGIVNLRRVPKGPFLV